jgi:PAS domain S-box-containing protein
VSLSSANVPRLDSDEASRSALLSAIVDSSDDAIVSKDLNGVIMSWNKGAERVFGYSSDEAVGQSITIVIPPDRLHEEPNILDRIRRGERIEHYETVRRRKDGTLIDIALTVSPVRNADGKVIGASKIARDITATKRIERALREREEVLAHQARLLDVTHEPIFTWRLNGGIEFWNRGAELLYGWTAEEARGRVSHDLLQTIHPIPFAEILNELNQNGQWTGELTHTTRDGRMVNVDSRHMLVRMPDGEPLVLESNRDITERRKTDEALRTLAANLEEMVRERTAQLEAANRELQSFSYSISHDLRAPLRSIEGFSNMLLRDYPEKFDARAKDLFGRIQANTVRMGKLIESMLSLTRVSRAELHREQIDLGAIAASAIEELRVREGGRSVSTRIDRPVFANGDPALLRSAMENLLGNAWKFTRRAAEARIEFGREHRDGRVVFYVRDNGVGFDTAYKDQLFVPFHRLHRAQDFEGTGIGLATVARIIHRHGGDIWAESEPGQGTVFYFTL